jgi:hypothetical protein
MLIEGLTSDGKEKDALFRRWNDDKNEGEIREIKKWEKKLERIKLFPDNPSFEEEDLSARKKAAPPKISSRAPMALPHHHLLVC